MDDHVRQQEVMKVLWIDEHSNFKQKVLANKKYPKSVPYLIMRMQYRA